MKNRTIMSIQQKRCMLLVLTFMIVISSVIAHKESAETTQAIGNYQLLVSMAPAHPSLSNVQTVMLNVRDAETKTPVAHLDVAFSLYKVYITEDQEIVDAFIMKYAAKEEEHGTYLLEHQFTEVGSYKIKIDIVEESMQKASLTKNLYVEPRGPSPAFWTFMILSIVVAIYIARRSNEL